MDGENNGNPIINHPFWGYHYFWKQPYNSLFNCMKGFFWDPFIRIYFLHRGLWDTETPAGRLLTFWYSLSAWRQGLGWNPKDLRISAANLGFKVTFRKKILNPSWFFCEGTKAFKKKSAKHLGDYWDYEFFFFEKVRTPTELWRPSFWRSYLNKGHLTVWRPRGAVWKKWQTSHRNASIQARCNTFGAWRYFDNSKFWFCLFCIYRHIHSMVFFFKLCFSFSTSSPINLFAVFQGCHNAGSELCSPAGPCSLAGKTIPAAG